MYPPIDRVQAARHLKLARRQVAEGRQRIAKQQELVARLERNGHDAKQANALLSQFEETLTLQKENLDRIKQEVGESE
jgi:hypothetical protein